MIAFLLSALLLAVPRADLIERFKSPVVTQADGFVRVYANCAPDIRRDYQLPIARFAGDTVTTLTVAAGRKLEPSEHPRLTIHLGDVRTNRTDVIARVSTNETGVLTRIFLPCPAEADLDTFRAEIARAYFRSVEQRELTPIEALERFRLTDPDYRVACARRKFSGWLRRAEGDDAEGFGLLYRVLKPGHLSREEALVFAARLRLYPAVYARPFLGRYESLSFGEAIACASDPAVRLAAYVKSNEMPIFGGGRGAGLQAASDAYRIFLLALAAGETSAEELRDLLEKADARLNAVYEETK